MMSIVGAYLDDEEDDIHHPYVFSSCFHQVPNYVPQVIVLWTSYFITFCFFFKFINYMNMGNIIIVLYDNVINIF